LQSFAKELCFVWGAPLSGQRRWMMRSAELSKPEMDVTLCFSRPEETLDSLVRRMEQEMEKLSVGESVKAQHLYVELPSQLLHEDLELEEWIAVKKDWSVSFAGIVSEQSHLLNEYYHQLYEEFSRSSQSAVILARSLELRDELPQWVRDKDMDFGKYVQVFEDDLWPKSLLHGVSGPRTFEPLKTFEEEYQEMEFPISVVEKQKVEILMRQLLQGDFGTLWGAEIIMPREVSGPMRSEWAAYTLCAQNIYEWRSSSRARCVGLSKEVALLSLAGVGLQKNSLTQSLRALQLLSDS
jgi:hypothetical protein